MIKLVAACNANPCVCVCVFTRSDKPKEQILSLSFVQMDATVDPCADNPPLISSDIFFVHKQLNVRSRDTSEETCDLTIHRGGTVRAEQAGSRPS